jgi:hypothetical protein
VPKAPIDEYRDAFFVEYEIRTPWQRRMAPPASDAMRAQNPGELQLGVFIAARANCSHDRGSLCLRENIGHQEVR